MEGHKFSFGAVNCTASVAAGARATVPETECVEGVGGELVSACMTHSHGLLHGILCIIPSNKRVKKPTLRGERIMHSVPLDFSCQVGCRWWLSGLCKGTVMAFLSLVVWRR